MRGVYLLAATIAAGLFGLFAAANAHGSSGYTVGLGLTVACILFGFQIIRSIVDGTTESRLLPDRPGSGWTTIAVLGVIGLIGLFVAAGGEGGYYWTGLAITGAAIMMIALIMKRIFDRHDHSAQRQAGSS